MFRCIFAIFFIHRWILFFGTKTYRFNNLPSIVTTDSSFTFYLLIYHQLGFEDKMESNDKTHSSKPKITSKSLTKMISEEGSFEKLLGSNKLKSPTLCDVDRLTSEDLQNCLKRAKENPTQPFSFLKNIPDVENIEANALSKAKIQSTDIDTKLTNLIKRVELNTMLLEKTNQRVKDIDLLVKQRESILPTNQFYDENLFMKMKSSDITESSEIKPGIEHPEIEEYRRTMSDTKDLLDYVKKISKEEMDLDDLPANLLARMGSSIDKLNKKTSEKTKLTEKSATR